MPNNRAVSAQKKIDVAYVAQLARIDLSEEELKTFETQLSQILDYVEMLSRVDISGVPETPIDPHLPTNVLRADEPRPSLDRALALALAPQASGHLWVTPKVVES